MPRNKENRLAWQRLMRQMKKDFTKVNQDDLNCAVAYLASHYPWNNKTGAKMARKYACFMCGDNEWEDYEPGCLIEEYLASAIFGGFCVGINEGMIRLGTSEDQYDDLSGEEIDALTGTIKKFFQERAKP